jgi:hypothetical protein
MNQLHDFFENATSDVYNHLRNRRAMLNHKAELEKQQQALAKRIHKFEQAKQTQIRVARSRLRAAEAEFNQRTIEESQCWTAYQLLLRKTDSLPKCLGITFASLTKKQPGIATIVGRAKKLADDWYKSFQSLREAENELDELKIKYEALAGTIESDRFAIRNLSAQIQHTIEQLNSHEDEVNQLIKDAANHMSFASIARIQSNNTALDQSLFADVRALRRLLHRIDSLQHLSQAQPADDDARPLHQALEHAASQSFEEYKVPIQCDIPLRGKGRARQVPKTFMQANNRNNAPVDTRVVFSETKSFSLSLTLKQWDTERLGNELTDRPLLQLNRAIVASTKRETNTLVRQLTFEADLVTQRIAKLLFSRLNP